MCAKIMCEGGGIRCQIDGRIDMMPRLTQFGRKMAMDGVDGSISVAGLSVLLQSGALDPVDLAKATLEKIAGYRDQAIFTGLLAERALAEAKAAAGRIRSGRSPGLL